MNIGIAALSEVRRLDRGEIMAGGYAYYWSGCSNGYHAQGVAVAVSNKLTPMIIEVTPRKRAYYETKDSSLVGNHFPGLCICSD